MRFLRGDNDFATTPERALDEIDPKWREYDGLIIFGSHAQDDVEDKIRLLQHARENGIPTLGICFGMHLMAVEYARNVLGLQAHTVEVDMKTKHPVVTRLDELRVGIRKVGDRHESHWHNYAIDEDYLIPLNKGFQFTMTDDIAEIIRHKEHPFYVGTQFHPEYNSSKDNPHPLLVEFLDVCRKG